MATSKIPANVIAPVKQKCAEITGAFTGVTHVYGYAPWPDHSNRRCVDYMVGSDRKAGDQVAQYHVDNHARLGVRVIIWQGRIWRSYNKLSGTRSPGRAYQWAAYNEADKHTDHPHVEYDSGSYVPPKSPLAGTVWVDRLRPGVTDSDSVRLVQRALGIAQTGAYDSATVAAVKARQRAWGDAPEHCDGILGPKQLALLMVEAGMRVDIRTDPSGPVTPPPPPPPTYPVPAKREVYLDRLREDVQGSDSVWWVQSALARLGHYTGPLSGAYGPVTLTAVKRYQMALGDDPKHCDGLLGEKQTIRLFSDAAMPITIYRSSETGGQVWPEIEEPPVVKPTRPIVTVVSANVLRRTDPDKTRRRWIDRLPDIVAHIRSGSPTLVLLQEVDTVTASDVFEGLGPSWHYDRCHGLAIGWFSPELERIGDAQCVLYPDRENRYRHSIQLRHRVSGQQFWADCTHLENDGDPATDGHRARHTEITAFAAGTKTGKRVFGGDLNSTTPSTTSATERQRQKPRPILRGAGWWLLTDQTDVTDRALESHHGGKTRNGGKGPWIDDAGGKGVSYVKGSGRLIRTDKTDASDHHFLRFAVQL